MTVTKAVAAEIRRLYFAEHWNGGAGQSRHSSACTSMSSCASSAASGPRRAAFVPMPACSTLARYPRLVATRIHDMLVERGYEGSLRTLRRYVLEARPAARHEAFLRVETLPGEQAQVDWGHVGTLAVPGGRRALWVFVIVLGYPSFHEVQRIAYFASI